MPTWFFLSLLATALWVSGNLIDKVLVERYRVPDGDEGPIFLVVFSSFAALALSLAILGVVVLISPAGYEWSVDPASASKALPIAFLAGLSEMLWVYLYLRALENSEASSSVPILQTIPLFGLVLAFMILGERPSNAQLLSGAFVVFGAVLISMNASSAKKAGGTFGIDWATLGLMFAAAFLIAATDSLFKYAALMTGYWPALVTMGFASGLVGPSILIVSRRHRRFFVATLRRSFRNVLLLNGTNEVFDLGANMAFAAATLLAPIAVVESTNAFQPLALLLLAGLASRLGVDSLREDFQGMSAVRKLVAIGVISIGSYFLLRAS